VRRRVWLALGAAAALPGCALGRATPGERIVDVATGRPLGRDEVLSRFTDSEIVLLGEQHDNPHHHARRAELLAAMPAALTVVAEYLPRGAAPALPPDASGESLRRALEAVGFDARSWRWPMHEPLFAAIARGGHMLRGGNLDRETARRLAREGAGAMPSDLASLLQAAPLRQAARAALESDLRDGHCGQLPAARLPGMVAAQRGRDAAMARVLIDAFERRPPAAESPPVVLLAGNGHVRRDYGVPQVLAGWRAGAQVLSIGFVEIGAPVDAPFHITWALPAAPRDDPCRALAPAPAASR
jgi:uncharacterized iron-regulated protein